MLDLQLKKYWYLLDFLLSIGLMECLFTVNKLNINIQENEQNRTSEIQKYNKKQPGLGLKPLKEDCFTELLSHASFLKFKRGEFGNVVQPYLMKHRHNQ